MATQDKYQHFKNKNTRDHHYSPPQRKSDEEIRYFGKPVNEWQRVGQNSDQNWWDSGTQQQMDTFGGEMQYPYRRNDWDRNQEKSTGIENLYPQEPASEQQRRHFAEGSQYPYEGNYGANKLQDREGLERTREWNQQQTNNPNQQTNQNKNTMRTDDRNFERDYYNRDENYGRDRNRDYRIYGSEAGRDDRGWNRDRRYEQDRDFNQRYGENRYEQRNRGQYHSTETDQPGRGFDSEREMNRRANNYGDNRYGNQSGRNYRNIMHNSVSSSHRATGPYEDFERDLDRFGMRDDDNRNREQGAFSGRRNYNSRLSDTDRFNYHPDYQERYYNDRDRRYESRHSSGYGSEGDPERRRRLSSRISDRGLERSQRGNWGPSNARRDQRYYYDEGYEGGRGNY